MDTYLAQVQKLGSIGLLCIELGKEEPGQVRELIDKIKERSRGIIILLGMTQGEGKCSLFFSADKAALEFREGLSMSELIREAAVHIGGSGGGRPDMAQAGGKDLKGLKEALRYAQKKIEDLLG